ncbi:TetR/AcrR family transcriptional regulator [Nocardia sp. NBC_01327]|uniref:TetR/AcrR family transcriptional regulator n=1 Tax=Nocardia sp. NBC_01327 TaxID=2903593 RepID=UPI002E128A0F|nr:TetR/AcrR family transcriptional regulator [Nocardia sp. NBC_01327]
MSTPSRTQAERRAATVAALLDATIESLGDVGYYATTTRSVAERAGVSQGAQQHYFPTKADLVDAAISRLLEQLAISEIGAPIEAPTELGRAAILLDRLWDTHNLSITPAVFEVFNAARTDADIAQRVNHLLGQAMSAVEVASALLLPTYAERPGFRDFLLLAVSAMRGAVLVSAISGTGQLHPSWPALRRQLLESLEALSA